MRRILLVLFFASGAAGLVYEVIWVRLFGLVMGNTVFSITTVLAAFMGGLALGSALGGRAAARAARPVRVYALLEAGVGLYCLAVPLLVSALEPACRYLYRNLYDRFLLFHLCLFLLGALVLVPGTALMGATLPFLARAVAGDERRLGTRLGDLYSANTAGAVVGVLAAGFFLIPGLGLSWTNRLGAAANLAVAAVAWALAKRLDAGTIRAEARGAAPADLTASPPVSRLATITLLAAFGASGATSLSYQIAWARSFTMAIGASTYSFTVIVAAFILGIALGSAIFGRLA
ncbi:MAG: fused MFS/spermidine synthase, partial [Planctomycetes bacterium]|nr:fused MFS/spermidine synthase [Planctomycetota bacterium]